MPDDDRKRDAVMRFPHINTRVRSGSERPRQRVLVQCVQGLQTVLVRADDEDVHAFGCTQEQQIRGLRARPHRDQCFRKG